MTREEKEELLSKIWDMPKPKDDSNYWQGVDDVADLISNMPITEREDLHREKEQAYMQGYEDASKKYRAVPEREKGEWIPVIEKLPEDKQKVLCCVTNEKHSVVIMYFEDASYWHDGKISAWMPCPEPYGGDK